LENQKKNGGREYKRGQEFQGPAKVSVVGNACTLKRTAPVIGIAQGEKSGESRRTVGARAKKSKGKD